MGIRRSSFRYLDVILAGGLLLFGPYALGAGGLQPAQQPAAGPTTRQIGTIKAIQEKTILLATDAGSGVSVTVSDAARLLRTEPGQTDLKAAVTIAFQDLQVGDRVLVRGTAGEDGKSLAASMVVAIKKESIEQKQAREREDWQKRGLAGLVKEVDPTAQTLTVTMSALAGRKPVLVRVGQGTILRRYASHSVRFDDAKPGKFEEIKPGDQFRGRGKRSADGGEFEADEMITGSFRNIAGSITSVDAGSRTLTVEDLITKAPVVVRVTADSSLRKLPETMAEGIAMRLSRSAPNGPPSGPGGQPSRPGAPPPEGGPPGNGPSDFQQMVARLPAASLGDFPSGEVVMIVASSGDAITAINLLGGVEPLLRASPEGDAQNVFSSWNLGGPSSNGGEQQSGTPAPPTNTER